MLFRSVLLYYMALVPPSLPSSESSSDSSSPAHLFQISSQQKTTTSKMIFNKFHQHSTHNPSLSKRWPHTLVFFCQAQDEPREKDVNTSLSACILHSTTLCRKNLVIQNNHTVSSLATAFASHAPTLCSSNQPKISLARNFGEPL